MISKDVLLNDTTRMYAMVFIFARGVAPFAGDVPDPVLAAKAGMDEVYQWWCTHGFIGQSGDIRETAAMVAQEVAEHVGFDSGVLDTAVAQSFLQWEAYSCPRGDTPRWSGYASSRPRKLQLALPSAGHLRALPPPK